METTSLYPSKQIEIWFQDEGRFGQMGRLAHRWWLRGERPLGLYDRRFSSTYIYAAVCPSSGDDFALVLPKVNTKTMNCFLEEFSASRPDNVHVVLVLDRAGWHRSKGIELPTNITLVPLPPYSPELNPVERVWLYLRERYYSHRALKDYNDIVDACCHAWMSLISESGIIHSLTSYPWLPTQCNAL